MTDKAILNFEYDPRLRALHYFLPLLMFLFSPFLVLLISFQVLRIFMDPKLALDESVWVNLILLVISVVGLHNISTVNLNFFPNIRLQDDGALIRVFDNGFRWEFVPWKNFKRLLMSPRLGPQFSTIWIFEVEKFKGSHDLLRLYSPGRVGLGFIVHSSLPNYEYLLDTIVNKTGLRVA